VRAGPTHPYVFVKKRRACACSERAEAVHNRNIDPTTVENAGISYYAAQQIT
jgi:hypothetical protein